MSTTVQNVGLPCSYHRLYDDVKIVMQFYAVPGVAHINVTSLIRANNCPTTCCMTLIFPVEKGNCLYLDKCFSFLCRYLMLDGSVIGVELIALADAVGVDAC